MSMNVGSLVAANGYAARLTWSDALKIILSEAHETEFL